MNDEQSLLTFWAFGDLHFRALPTWNAIHSQRLAPMFEDLQTLWRQEGKPAFCVSPGDIIETCALENYQLAAEQMQAHLQGVPFYPGIGNHEYHGPDGEDEAQMAPTYTHIWGKPLRYTWTTHGITSIMLDYPGQDILKDPKQLFIGPETLRFLEQALAEHSDTPALIFLHAPLRDTVLDRDPQHFRDFNSLQSFFAPNNSQEIRDILAKHKNACLYFSGHTHSGWEAPQLVLTEELGGHPVTFVNLMSPWYTGTHTGPRVSEDKSEVSYQADDPDVIPTFRVRLYADYASICVRDSKTRTWLKEWQVAIH